MKRKRKNNGSVFLMVVFVIALLAAMTMGILQVNTEEIQLMRNQIYAAEALAIAEAGLNDAFAEIRADSGWRDGFGGKGFLGSVASKTLGGSYTVDVSDYDGAGSSDLTIVSTGTSSRGFVARMAADVTVGTTSPYAIRIDNLRINEQE